MFEKIIPLFRASTNAASQITNSDESVLVPACDLGGNVWVRLASTIGGEPIGGSAMNIDNVAATLIGLDSKAFLYGFDGTNWDRLRTILDNADAQAVDAAIGRLAVLSRNQGFNGTTWDRLRTLVDNSDAQAAGILGLLGVENRNQLFNETTYDRQRGNTDITVLASAVRAATTNSADITNFNGRGLHLVLDITAVPGVDTVLLTVQGKDALSGAYYTILAGAAQVGIATVPMRVYPALTPVANLTANDILPRTWRVNVIHSGAGNFTYSVGASIIL